MSQQPQIEQMSRAMQQCIQNCMDCHAICMTTTMHCLQIGGKHAEPQHIKLLQDCAEICQTSANFMLRQSMFHSLTCGVCAEICERCAEDCERMADGDSQMLACATMCRQCAGTCHEMSQEA